MAWTGCCYRSNINRRGLDGRQGGEPVAPDVARVADVVVGNVVDASKKVYIWAQQCEYFIQFPIDLPRGNINNHEGKSKLF